MPNIRLRLEYDGTLFRGWQVQPGERTVQGALEDALRRITGDWVRVTAAGRTDTGVHALDQVVNFKYDGAATPAELARSINGVLPRDVAVWAADVVPDAFNARFDARKRAYEYRISTRRRAVGSGFCWWVRVPLRVDAMNHAGSALLGRRDFTSFCVAAGERESRVCEVSACAWSAGSEPGLLVLTIEADRFVRAMVRGIVGTLVDIGRGRLPEAAIADILASEDRRCAGATAPARGLFLKRVDYEV